MHARFIGAAGLGLVALLALVAAAVAFSGPVAGVGLPAPVPLLELELGLTPLAAPFCALLGVLAAAAALHGVRFGRPRHAALIASFTLAMLLVLAARSLVTFAFGWEAMSVLAVLLILDHHERPAARRTAVTYLIVSQCGAFCAIAALALLAVHAGSGAFDALARSAPHLPPDVRAAALWLALLGFGSKAGLVPLHFWLPRAHAIAPAAGSALLSGAMLKVALYGIALVAFSLAAPPDAAWARALLLLGIVSAVGGIVYALVDADLKRLLAYSSIEHVGIVAMGLGAAALAAANGAAAIAGLALCAALFHALNHGVFKALLFLGAGALLDSEGTTDLDRLGGALQTLPWTGVTVLVGCAAAAALPPFNGFASEWLTFRALLALLAQAAPLDVGVAIAALGGLALAGGLSVACFVKAFGIAFLGAPRRHRPAPATERVTVATLAPLLLAAICVAAGLVPDAVLAPLRTISRAVVGVAPSGAELTVSPLALALLPLLGAAAAAVLAAFRGLGRVAPWTCGSPVGPHAQYSATAFTKPLRTVFAALLLPQRRRTAESGPSPWFPQRIVYRTEHRYLADELARRLAALALLGARRWRHVQSGSLRLYVAYAVAGVVLVVLAAR